MDREEHLIWCKQRAREYAERGEAANAVASMLSDLAKHPDLKPNASLGMLGLMLASQRDHHGVRNWIEGFR